ncbi:MAG: serine acetyltransferase [Thermotogaceae bacterium]|nr:serine acetyltransferase [Mesotoga sp.]NLX33138.1 serine acetyltransferase [Thermotogaceae bacterium]MDD4039374.1 serine O-acetyltransferase [Mesotoga sp.]MDD5744822.1 serine O-acetyltransferase [Mesotoga sp.]HPX21377.1 serine O-acetyltransferase [Mesotoga sp.]
MTDHEPDKLIECVEEVSKRFNSLHLSRGLRSLGSMRQKTIRLIDLIRDAIFPEIAAGPPGSEYESLSMAVDLLREVISQAQPAISIEKLERIAVDFVSELPAVAETLMKDVQAAYEGDPAAQSLEEIMVAYPAFEAINIYRLAHILYLLGIPLIPRVMTEYAHQKTGIDIHPGASIGSYFFIDHGTGVVIGETCTIGDHVKIYQGVTLGAKSFELDENGNPIKGIKRHPDIGNHVVIYAGATVLGGDTVIGDNCTIGGNVWLIHSLEAGKTLYNNP